MTPERLRAAWEARTSRVDYLDEVARRRKVALCERYARVAARMVATFPWGETLRHGTGDILRAAVMSADRIR